MIKAVLFDLDGVLVSTDMMHYTAWKRLADELHIPDFTKEDNLRQRGVSRMASLEILLEKSKHSYTEQEKDELAARKNRYYVSLLETLSPRDILPGALEAIESLRRRGILIAVGSASKNTPEILRRTGLESYIDRVSCGLDVTRSKPDPQVFLVAAQKLGVAPVDCLVVEDSDSGIQAAKTAGMRALAVGAARGNVHADYRADSLERLDIDSLIS
jgi:beta-phosphoglucomutase